MAKKQRGDLDSPWKEALQHFLRFFLAFFFPRLQAAIDWRRGYVALDKEFQQIVRNARIGKQLADKLFKVWLKSGKEAWLLIHVEIQGKPEKRFPRRMFQYNTRCFHLYRRRVISLAVLSDDRPNWRPDRFFYGGWGCKVGIIFPVAKLLDYADKAAAMEKNENPFAQVVLAHLKALETRRNPALRRQRKTQLVKGLYERGWKAEDVRQMFRLIDWLMDLPMELQIGFREELYQFEEEKHMPYLSSFERMAIEKGREEGREEGRKEELLETIRLTLEDKFGDQGLKLLPKIRVVKDLGKLRTLRRALLKANNMDAVRRLVR